MLTFFLFICALPALIVLFLIGLRILQEIVSILLAGSAAIAAIVLVAWSVDRFFDWTPAEVTEIVVTALVGTLVFKAIRPKQSGQQAYVS